MYGMHIVGSAMPRSVAIAFSRHDAYPQDPQLSSSSGAYLPTCCRMPRICSSVNSVSSTLRSQYSRPRSGHSERSGSGCFPRAVAYRCTRCRATATLTRFSSTGPLMHPPEHAISSTIATCSPPTRMPSRMLRHTPMPVPVSTCVDMRSVSSFAVASNPPSSGNSLAGDAAAAPLPAAGSAGRTGPAVIASPSSASHRSSSS